MALEYEVRAEYQSMSLDQLLDAPVMCFEGVGDTQNDILNRYFSITTVRQLANMPYFLWSLGIQEMALKGGEASTTPVNNLSQSETLKFSVTPHAQGKDPVELLNSSVNVLDGLTPVQNLALYDSFRVTNVVQLAHNRIMLEARVIEYLQKHPELVEAGESPDRDEVASILGADTEIASSGDEAQGMLSGSKAPAGLQEMAVEIGDHVRGRIDALKDRAAERAKALAATTNLPSDSEITESIESRRMSSGATTSRDDALRAIRERTESTRVQPVTSSGSDRTAALEAARGAATTAAGAEGAAPGTDAGGTGAEGAAPGTDAGGTGAEGAAPGTEAGDAGAEGAAPGTEAGGTDTGESAAATAGGEPEEYSTAPGMTVRPGGGEETGAEEEGGEATPEGAEEGEAPAEGFSFKPWMAAAATALVVLIGLIVWLIPSGKEDAEPTSPVADGSDAQGTGATTEPQPSAVATTPPPDPGPPIRTIHTVVKGESLWRISRRHYQNPLLWPKIYRANEDQIEDPDLIFPNQEIKIPETQ